MHWSHPLQKYLRPDEIARMRGMLRDLGQLERMAGDDTRFTASTARILHAAFKEARLENPDRLSRALAPTIAKSIKAEIRNSRDEVVEALTPIVASLVDAAVRDAVSKLDRDVKNALPFERWKAALSSQLFGGSAAMRLKDEHFSVRDALVVDRRSGALLARRSADDLPDDSGESERLGAVVAAVAELAAQISPEGPIEALRRIELDGQSLFIRATAASLLVVRCEGRPPEHFEIRLAQIFDRFVPEIARARLGNEGEPDSAEDAARPVPLLLEDLARDSARTALVSAESSPVTLALGAVIGVAIACGLWIWAQSAHSERREALVTRQIEADTRLSAYPYRIETREGTITLDVLVPDALANAGLKARLSALRLARPISADIAEIGSGSLRLSQWHNTDLTAR
ncbi:MAG: hypothetical protein MRY63_13290 [Neomegalonema sp.]|nr:hypothetical protein [Neomegalonema sp.]